MADRGNRWVLHLAYALAAAAVLAGALAVLSGFGTRWGWWHFRTGFSLLGRAALAGAALAVLGLVTMILARRGPQRALLAAGFALVVGGALFVLPWRWQASARTAPPIHDITTDVEDPPAFVAIAPLRADAPNPVDYAGEEVAAQQRAAYPEVTALVLPLPVDAAFERALAAAAAMGWEIVAADAAAGRIEATDRTVWFGFYDDVVIRLTATDSGTRVDVRSKSRVGRGDMGTNARRVLAYLDRLR
jgi:uncharacterized protein (DUF1499 family)